MRLDEQLMRDAKALAANTAKMTRPPDDQSRNRADRDASAPENAGKATATADEVPSPCTRLCRLDAGGEYCLGCFRSLDEIAAWQLGSAAQRRAIVASAQARRAAREVGKERGAGA